MKEITGVNHLGLRVQDLAQSRAFYEKLGFIFLVGPIGPEPVAIMEHPSGVNINFILNSNSDISHNILMDLPEKYPGYTHVALTVSNIESVERFLKQEKIAISEGPITLPNGAVMLFVRDPDENVIEFHQDPK
ncbi:VOC family protein [Thalassotalea fonticola]|uniref:VOC family protein n=1 Tax=Thalassotalea fonticola TaxID=3065649 RepID=A0ABZ0GK68_9GAMM|nr:VOC family protein [Colwelliaceae bacterium S1-1]